MRWILRGVAVLVVLVGVAAVVIKTSAHTTACQMALRLPDLAFVGTVVTKDGADVTFRVEELDANPAVVPNASPRPEVGDDVTIRYDRGDERLVRQGPRYHVSAYGTFPGELHSRVHRAGECAFPDGIGTVYADGSTIGADLFTRDGIEPYRIPLGIAGMAVAAIGLLIVKRLHDRRRARLVAEPVDSTEP